MDATVGAVPDIGARVVRAEDTASATAASLDDDPRVDYAEVNRRMRAAVVPNDPLFHRQALRLIGALEAWDARALAGFPTGGGPVVGIVDYGVRTTHATCRARSLAASPRARPISASPGRRAAAAGRQRPRHARHGHDRLASWERHRDRRARLQLHGDQMQGADASNVGLMSDISACIVACATAARGSST